MSDFRGVEFESNSCASEGRCAKGELGKSSCEDMGSGELFEEQNMQNKQERAIGTIFEIRVDTTITGLLVAIPIKETTPKYVVRHRVKTRRNIVVHELCGLSVFCDF